MDFFVGDRIADRPALYRPELLLAFGEALKLFWGLRLKSLFPEREFVFAIGDDLEGASGLAITLY